MDVINALNLVVSNMEKINNETGSLDSNLSFKDWLTYMNERGALLKKCSTENDICIKTIRDYASKPITDKSDADALYDAITEAYLDRFFEDAIVLLPLIDRLIEFYIANDDLEKIIMNLYRANKIYNESYCRRNNLGADLKYLEKLLCYKSRINEFSYKCKYVIMNAYFFAILEAPSISTDENDYYDYMQSVKYYYELKDFYANCLKEEDRNDEAIAGLYEYICYNVTFLLDSEPGKITKETRDDLKVIVNDIYNEIIKETNNPFDVPSDVYYRYICGQIDDGTITPKDAYLNYYDYMINSKEYEYNPNEERQIGPCALLICCRNILNEVEDKIFVYEEQKKLTQEFKKFVSYKYDISREYITLLKSDWMKDSIPNLLTVEEKEQEIFELIKINQIQTYLHSVMVKNLSVVLFETLYRANKSLFDGIDMEYDELKEYVTKSALLHDVGKLRLTELMNTQGRSLTDEEFIGIKSHPEIGTKIVKYDSIFSKYNDPILFHHKWYNGQGGYPVGFDNTKSKVRIIVDIITICDCIDAATDYVGRVYKNNKTFKDILEELSLGAGTKYNPDIVNIIKNDSMLIQIFESITGILRTQEMYKAYNDGLC